MEIYCPNCEEIVGKIADEKIPPNKRGHLTCPKCQSKIPVFREVKETDFVAKETFPEQTESAVQVKKKEEEPEKKAVPPPQPKAPRKRYKPKFTGSAGEYFRIWIVNTFLTILTVGIYGAWAKVRTRRYFYAHTKLAGHSFDYLANPIAILKGNLIIAAGLISYNASQFYSPILTIVIAVAFAIFFPFLIYKSIRFYAHNSAFRNIRFRFRGTLGDSYRTYLLLPIGIPITFGLIIPYWVYRRKEYFFNNFAFGKSTNRFRGEVGPFYATYFKAFLMTILLFILFGVISSMGIAGTVLPSMKGAGATPGSENPALNKMIIAIAISSYLFMLIVMTGIQQYLYARLTNYCWESSAIGKVHFRSTIQAKKLLWIRLTNIMAIIVSIGLLMPWAKIRRTRYIYDNLNVFVENDLDQFTSAAEPEEGAVGDAATDFFDFEIGL